MNGRIFLISDTHFNHKNIIQYCDRPFHTVGEMNELIIYNWNKVVGEDDIVYHLGDFALGDRDECISIGQRLNGHKILIRGNHDHASDSIYLNAGFETIYKKPIDIEYGGRSIHLSHHPQQENNKVDFSIFGHIHNHHDEYIVPKTFCVSVERINYTPILLDNIIV